MIVLGIDPGSRRCGYGVVARREGRLTVVESGVLVPGDLPVAERLARILTGLEAVIARARPAEVAVEDVYSGASPRSALVLGQARGVALAAAARAGLPVFEYQPSQVKLAFTGSGRASKEQMVRTARTLLGVAAELSDEADAVALAVCHLAHLSARGRSGRLRGPRAPPGSPLAPGQAPSPAPALARDGSAPPPARLARLRPSRRDFRRPA